MTLAFLWTRQKKHNKIKNATKYDKIWDAISCAMSGQYFAIHKQYFAKTSYTCDRLNPSGDPWFQIACIWIPP